MAETKIAVGSPAPWPAGIVDQNGKAIKLSGFAGKNVLLYFYPKDDTPGCTREACNFRDYLKASKYKNTVIFGASLDDADSHKAFIKKFELPFDLLVDPDKALAKAYGVLNPEQTYTLRQSALIGPDGKIRAFWPKVDAKVHHDEVLKALEGSSL